MLGILQSYICSSNPSSAFSSCTYNPTERTSLFHPTERTSLFPCAADCPVPFLFKHPEEPESLLVTLLSQYRPLYRVQNLVKIDPLCMKAIQLVL
jgi:hypothetical protein